MVSNDGQYLKDEGENAKGKILAYDMDSYAKVHYITDGWDGPMSCAASSLNEIIRYIWLARKSWRGHFSGRSGKGRSREVNRLQPTRLAITVINLDSSGKRAMRL